LNDYQRPQTATKITETASKQPSASVATPTFRGRPIDSLRPADVLPLLRRIEAAGRHETAHRTRADVSRVMRHAVATGRAERDITVDLRGALAPVKAQHFAAITDPARIGDLMRAIDGYRGQPATEYALKLAPSCLAALVSCAPQNGASSTWMPPWRIPAPRTKMRCLHIVPLARQARDLLTGLMTHTRVAATYSRRCAIPIAQCPKTQRSDIFGRCVVRRPSCTAFLSAERLPPPVALHVHFKNPRVMHETINRRERHGGIAEHGKEPPNSNV